MSDLESEFEPDVLAALYEAENMPVQPVQPDRPVSWEEAEGTGEPVTADILAEVREWLGRFVRTVDDADLDLLSLWAAHTHLAVETYTTPRLLLDSPVPGSGKTTVLEHLERLCLHPVQMASLSSPALLARMLHGGMRTILIDEADRSLNPDKDGVAELLAVLNSGYKRGGTRPVLVPAKGGDWAVAEMPTYSPVAMAGNSPNLPDDTRSRSIRVLLMPDVDETADESDWEWIEDEARWLGKQLAAWADQMRDDVRLRRPELPDGVRGRARERWSPLKRVAEAAGGHWPALVDQLAAADVQRLQNEREEGIVQQRPHVALLTHVHRAWREGETFIPTDELIGRLVDAHPDMWGDGSAFGKRLNPQRLGRMLSTTTTCVPPGRTPTGHAATSARPWEPRSAGSDSSPQTNRPKWLNRLNRHPSDRRPDTTTCWATAPPSAACATSRSASPTSRRRPGCVALAS